MIAKWDPTSTATAGSSCFPIKLISYFDVEQPSSNQDRGEDQTKLPPIKAPHQNPKKVPANRPKVSDTNKLPRIGKQTTDEFPPWELDSINDRGSRVTLNDHDESFGDGLDGENTRMQGGQWKGDHAADDEDMRDMLGSLGDKKKKQPEFNPDSTVNDRADDSRAFGWQDGDGDDNEDMRDMMSSMKQKKNKKGNSNWK